MPTMQAELAELARNMQTRLAKVELAKCLLTKPSAKTTRSEVVLLKALMNDGEIKAICDQLDKKAAGKREGSEQL